MLSLEFEKNGETIALTENDLFDFRLERGCFSGDTFELGGVNSNLVYCVIDNNTGRFPRGSFANSRLTLYIDGVFCGSYNTELPKRRNGVIEVTAYDDMLKLDCEFPDTYVFPQTFWSVYAECLFEAGLASDISFDNFVLNALFNNGVISHEYTEYIYANSCRNLVSGMAEWNGGFAYINDDGKLQVDVFSKDVKKTLYSRDLMAFDYSDETVTFSRIKTSQKNKTYEMGDDTGYTLVIRNQYIGYGLDDEDFETYFGYLYDYYKDFSLTPMTFTLAEPDLSLKIGDRISVVDEEENVTVTGNISKIVVRGNCSMEITCGGFGNIGSASNYKPTSSSRTAQAKTEAIVNGGGGVGKASEWDNTSEYFNDYDNNIAGNKEDTTGTARYATAMGQKTTASGSGAVAMGSNSKATGAQSVAAGSYCTASGSQSFAMGSNCTASGSQSFAMGVGAASGGESVAFGVYPTAKGTCSFAGGMFPTASADQAFAFGNNVKAAGRYSFAVGSGTEASGEGSIAAGLSSHTVSSGECSVAIGYDTQAAADYAVAIGYYAKAPYEHSCAIGKYTTCTEAFQTVVGAANKTETSEGCVFVVGNGPSDVSRSTAFTVDWDGNAWCQHNLICKRVVFEDEDADVTTAKIVFIDHAPVQADLKGTPRVLVQYDPDTILTDPNTGYNLTATDMSTEDGDSTTLRRIVNIFAEVKS